MPHLPKLIALGALSMQLASAQAVLSPTPKADAPAAQPASEAIVPASSLLPEIPALPHGKTTLIGGSLSRLDRIHDELAIEVFGGQKMKILFDERTQVFRNGERA